MGDQRVIGYVGAHTSKSSGFEAKPR
jgi:hypothetical protein